MNWRLLIARIVGLYYISFGTLTLYIFSKAVGRMISEGTRELMPTFQTSSTGFFFYAGDLSLLIQIILVLPAGIMLAWKLKRWAAIAGSTGILVPSLTSLVLKILVSASGGPPLTELIPFKVLAISWGLFVGLPVLGIAFAWKELQ